MATYLKQMNWHEYSHTCRWMKRRKSMRHNENSKNNENDDTEIR